MALVHQQYEGSCLNIRGLGIKRGAWYKKIEQHWKHCTFWSVLHKKCMLFILCGAWFNMFSLYGKEQC